MECGYLYCLGLASAVAGYFLISGIYCKLAHYEVVRHHKFGRYKYSCDRYGCHVDPNEKHDLICKGRDGLFF